MTTGANGSLPRNWTCAELGQIADVQLGKMLDKKRTQGTPLRYLRNVNVRWGSIDTSDLLEMPFKERELDRYSLHPGDVLVCEGGEPGRAAVWQTDDPTIKYQKALHRVRMSGEILPHWLVFHLYFDAQRGALTKYLTGTTIKHFPRETFREYPLRVAPMPEQRRIVEAIESYFTRLDDAVATLERVQRNLKRYRASVLKAAVEGRLVPTEAELARTEGRDYEPASVLLERILAERRRRWEEAELARMKAKGKAPKDDKWKAKYKEPVVADSTALPDLPDGWCWASVDQLTSRITSGSRDWTQYYDRGDSVFLMAQNVRPGKLDLSYQQRVDPPSNDLSCERSQVLMDDLLVTIVGANTGNVCRVPTELPRHYVCQSVALMRPVDRTSSHYLDAYINSPHGQQVYARFMYGQGRPHLSFDNLKETPVPLPPSREQARIIESVERIATVDSAIALELQASTGRCTRLRQSILKWAFEGRLVDQDPTDEPASVLLERIQAEREAKPTQPARRRRARATTDRP